MCQQSADDPHCNNTFHMNYYYDVKKKKEFSVRALARNKS